MTSNQVRIAIGNITFDHATDDGAGTFYLHVGNRQAAADSPGTPRGPRRPLQRRP
jgi:hypothetical protein